MDSYRPQDLTILATCPQCGRWALGATPINAEDFADSVLSAASLAARGYTVTLRPRGEASPFAAEPCGCRAPHTPTLQERVQARDMEVECPACEATIDGWVCDPRGTEVECPDCAATFTVAKLAQVEFR